LVEVKSSGILGDRRTLYTQRAIDGFGSEVRQVVLKSIASGC